jgi:nitric-oxide synthase
MASPHLPFLSFPKTLPPPPPPLKPHAHRTSLAVAAAPAPPPAPPDGAGPAAPTRGDRFLGRQLATEAAARVLAPDDADRRRRRKEKRRALSRKPSGLASCYGCGAPLQTAEEAAPGYVDPDTYELVITDASSLPFSLH